MKTLTQQPTKFDYFIVNLNTYKKLDHSDVYLLEIIGQQKGYNLKLTKSQNEKEVNKWIRKLGMPARIFIITKWLESIASDYGLKFKNESMALQGGNKNTQLFTIEKI